MDPQLDFFLEDAFKSVARTSDAIGRVVIEPDYDVSPIPDDRDQLVQELIQLLQDQSPDSVGLDAPEGVEVEIPNKHPILAKYVRRISLHREPAEEPWIEVAPPGNWI